MSREPPRIDSLRCEALAAGAASGDNNAWKELIAVLWPAWTRQVRASRAMGSFARSEDCVRDVLANLVQKLGEDRARRLRTFSDWHERNPEKTFDDWARIVAANAIRDYVRAQLGAASTSEGEPLPSAKRLLNEFSMSPRLEELGFRPPVTAAQAARQLLEYAEAHLPPAQRQALGAWLDGSTFEEIERDLGLEEPGEAKRLVRAAIAVLRRRFAPEGSP